MGYNGQTGAVLEFGDGRTVVRDVPRGTLRLNGEEPTRWLRVSGGADVLEVAATHNLRASIADDLGVPGDRNLADVHGWETPIGWSILTRFRNALRGGPPMTDLEADHLLHTLYSHVFTTHFGGKLPDRAGAGFPLDGRRVRRVIELIDAHLGDSLTIAVLADAAAYSPFHLARAFKRATGLAPHQFVTARRVERARTLLLDGGHSVESVAHHVGFVNVGHFRRLFRKQVGMSPGDFRNAAAT